MIYSAAMSIDREMWGQILSTSALRAVQWNAHGIADAVPSTAPATVSRFDGVYGGLYDAVIHRRRVRSAAGRLWGRDSALSFLDDLFDRAFSGLRTSDRILDIPCGGGTTIRAATERSVPASIIGCDLSMAMLERAYAVAEHYAAGAHLVRCDATKLPFRDHSMHRAISINGLHCIANPAAFLSEVARVLVPGGELWMTTLVSSDSVVHMTIMSAAGRAGIIPGPAPTREALTRMAHGAGFDRIEDMGGVGIAAMRMVTRLVGDNDADRTNLS